MMGKKKNYVCYEVHWLLTRTGMIGWWNFWDTR